MACLNKRAKQLQIAREKKKMASALESEFHVLPHIVELLDVEDGSGCNEAWPEGAWVPTSELDNDTINSEESDLDSEDEEECEFTDGEDNEEFSDLAFEMIMKQPVSHQNLVKLKYTRGPEPSKKTIYRRKVLQDSLATAAMDSRPLHKGFLVVAQARECLNPEEPARQKIEEAVKDLESKLRSKRIKLEGQNLTRHRAVLAFLNLGSSRQEGETRQQLSIIVARCFNKGLYFARKVVSWELTWKNHRMIEEGRRGCFGKTRSWFNDEGVQLAVREWLAGAGEHITDYGLAKAIGVYLDSKRAEVVVTESFGPNGNRIRARTARRWLNQMGFSHSKVTKGVYVDGHERSDVVNYRNQVFIPQWKEYQRRMVIFDEDGSWKPPPTLREGEKPLVLVTHDESTFNANDGKRKMWMKDGKQPIRPKARGKGIMVSGFLTPGGRLSVPADVPDEELLRNPMWPKEKGTEKPVRDSMEFLEYGKNNYWDSEKMVQHTMDVAEPIFRYAFPGCQAVFAFDNASNHCCYSADALVVSRMRKNPGGTQPIMREGFIHSKQRPQSMVFPENHPVFTLRGKPKGIEQVLRERVLWKAQRTDGFAFLLDCPTSNNRLGCQPIEGGCCMRRVLSEEKDFQEQKGRLQEELEARNQDVLFYPKFHCELNFIEEFWCSAKWYARENCLYTLEGLRAVVPQALDSVTTATINRYFNHCVRIIDAYMDGLSYGTRAFKEKIYKGHRQVVDKSKW